MSPTPHIHVKVTFVHSEDGGRNLPFRSGSRSTLKVGDIFTSCIVWGETEEQVFDFGVEYDVNLELLSWDFYKDMIQPGMQAQLNEGTRTVGLGRINAIFSL